ncbi:MAG: hypothetical protein PSY14_13080 [bacterium]|nr:hypothetical protein [bacterium]
MAQASPKKSAFKKNAGRLARTTGLAVVFAAAAGCSTTPPIKNFPSVNDNVIGSTNVIGTTVAMPVAKPPVEIIVDTVEIPYDQQIFFYNAPATPPADEAALLAKMTSQQRAEFYMQKFCFRQGATPEEAAAQKEVYDALQSLALLPATGKPLIDLAAREGLQFCSLGHLPNGIAAQYLPSKETIVAGPLSKPESRVMTIAHEIMHAAQDRNKLLNYETNWDIQSRVQRNLSIEAAALTMEFLVAYDAKVGGNDAYWNYMQHYMGGTTYNDDRIYKLVEDTYKTAKDGGATHEESLRKVGAAVWTLVFESDDWRNFYLNHELTIYLRDIADNKFVDATVITHAQFADKTKNAGKVGALPSFTEGVTFPSLDSMLAKREKMKWAFEAAEIARMKQMEGANGKTVATLTAAATAGNNPYLGLDMADIYRKTTDESWTKGRTFRYIYHVMDEAIKPAEPAPVPEPPAPEKPAPAVVPPVIVARRGGGFGFA